MNSIYRLIGALCLACLLLPMAADVAHPAQIQLDGDFRMRVYSDAFDESLDNRGTENYARYLGRLRAKAQVNPKVHFYTELITWTQNNPVSPARNIAGTGKMEYGISQIFAEIVEPDFLVFDLFRARVGRQQFPVGEGLSQGESNNFYDKFDGIRFDMSRSDWVLSLFGSVTEQNVSESGLYPDPGSDQLYVARLTRPVLNQQVMGYYIYNKLRGQFNDSYVVGGGVSGAFMDDRLTYFAEAAWQDFNTLDGLPEKGGRGCMGGVSYRWSMGPFRSVKVETKYAAYQGDDASTDKVEIFSPLYPSFYWGSRRGYVDGGIGGDYPYNGRNPEGSRIWYSRIYVIPSKMPRLRLQLQYVKINEYVNNDDYNTMDDEFSAKLYYRLSVQTQLQLRFARNYPNGDDRDLNDSGAITWSEDRVKQTRFMAELQVKF